MVVSIVKNTTQNYSSQKRPILGHHAYNIKPPTTAHMTTTPLAKSWIRACLVPWCQQCVKFWWWPRALINFLKRFKNLIFHFVFQNMRSAGYHEKMIGRTYFGGDQVTQLNLVLYKFCGGAVARR